MVAGLDGIGFRHVLTLFGFPIPACARLVIHTRLRVDQTIPVGEADEVFCPVAGGLEAGAVLPGAPAGAAAGGADAVEAVDFFELFFFCIVAAPVFFFSACLMVLESVLV